MGLFKHFSSGSYPEPSRAKYPSSGGSSYSPPQEVHHRYRENKVKDKQSREEMKAIWKEIDKVKVALRKQQPLPNAANWEIVSFCVVNNFLVVEIKYPDCTNYEGHKILVYENIGLIELKDQKLIDPHFADHPDYHSPVARFEPTKRGWRMAKSFCLNFRED